MAGRSLGPKRIYPRTEILSSWNVGLLCLMLATYELHSSSTIGIGPCRCNRVMETSSAQSRSRCLIAFGSSFLTYVLIELANCFGSNALTQSLARFRDEVIQDGLGAGVAGPRTEAPDWGPVDGKAPLALAATMPYKRPPSRPVMR